MAKLKMYKKGIEVSRRAAAEGCVLLKNENGALPLSKNKTVALFGRHQWDTFKAGGGAADLWATRTTPIAEGMAKAGKVYKPLLNRYRAYSDANRDPSLNKFHHSFNMHKFFLHEVELTEEEVADAAAHCDTAVMFIGRFTIEGVDISDCEGQYRITWAEHKMLYKLARHFKKIVLVLTLPGTFDLRFLDEEQVRVDAIVQGYYQGMQVGHAIADVLYGDVPPTGKLPHSWAKAIYEYPTNEGFGTDKIVYSEGLYMGYRYFDTFKKDVVFPFGFGLSYTNFSLETVSCETDKTTVTVKTKVTNVGNYRGREVVQCYVSTPDGKLDKPYQTLCGFQKTAWLNPDESETVTVNFNLVDFSSYDEETASYILEKGDYIVRVGNSSRNTTPVCVVELSDTVVCKKTQNRVCPVQPIDELKKPESTPENTDGILRLTADFGDFRTVVIPEITPDAELQKTGDFTFSDVMSGKCTAEELVACLTDDELALLLTGDSADKQQALGLPQKPLAVNEGSHSHSIERLGIPSSTMQDGPHGVRINKIAPPPIKPDNEIDGGDCVCYPSETLLAATWDRKLVREVGAAIGVDLDKPGFNGLLAPGVNLHRNPLCGRNFEYCSEDPYLAAQIAMNIIKGVEYNDDGTPTKHYACIKHLICNNSENMRLVGDSILSERTLRELYLRAFEYVIRENLPLAIMTSYNIVNGTYASAHPGLINGIIRHELGYKGWIMTDWEIHCSQIDCIKAGIDICMPGHLITMQDLNNGGVTRATAQRRAVHLIKHLARTKHFLNGKLTNN